MATPFRFVDLPAEIRNHVYKLLFLGEQIHLEMPVADRNKMYQTSVPADRSLPGILLVSKTIRAESLPVFLCSATPVLYLYRQRDPAVPFLYLQFAKSLVAKGWYSWIPDRTLSPLVKILDIEDGNDEAPYSVGDQYDPGSSTPEEIVGNFKKHPCSPNGSSMDGDWLSGGVQVTFHARFATPSGKTLTEAVIDLGCERLIEWKGTRLN